MARWLVTEQYTTYATVEVEAQNVIEALAFVDEGRGGDLDWSYDTDYDDRQEITIEAV